jgi:hypothetical protein
MKKMVIASLFLLAFAGTPISATIAATDYSDPKQRNPRGDKDVEAGYQKNQQEHKEKQEKEKAAKENNESKTDKEDNYGKTYQEKQLGTEGKVRTY